MRLEPLELDGAFRVTPERHGDERGHLTRLFCRDSFAEQGLKDCSRQISEVANARAFTLRGLHFQRGVHAETKLFKVTRGAVYDVLVDIRPASRTYGHWQGFELNADDEALIYAPAGLAHGYLTLGDDSAMLYFIDTPYAPDAAAGLAWDDPALAIAWPHAPVVISDKDRAWPNLRALVA
jgi:dTDP-4-dehydrorhamnose 3,5-epimerase